MERHPVRLPPVRPKPRFTLASVLILSIGIVCVTVMFSTLNSVVLQPLPYENPNQLVWMWGSAEETPRNSMSAIDYWDYRDEARPSSRWQLSSYSRRV